MKLLVLTALFALAYAKHEQYIGWKSYYVGPANGDQLKSLRSAAEELRLDFLSSPSVQDEGVVLVQPDYQEAFTKTLENLGISYSLHADNIKAKLDHEDEASKAWKKTITRSGGRNLPYNDYQDFGSIISYMADTAERYPNIAELVNGGWSFEGRPLFYMKFSTTNFEDKSKPIIFIDGGIHAREWLSPPTVTYVINKLTDGLTNPDLLNDFDWILMPIVNPDGYVYSRTEDRFWRKTRSNDTHILSDECPGVDGNRNYDFYWNTVGTSQSPCWYSYAGDRAFSESETRLIRDLLQEHLARIALYLTMHSFGSMILYPWGNDGTLSHNAFALHTVGVAMADAIHKQSLPNFPNYQVGNKMHVLGGGISGASDDYAHYIGVPLAFTIRLPGLMRGNDGYHLEPKYIEQVVRETWEGIAVAARRAGDLFKP